ncbi:PsiF family protein [Pseudomonas sp. X10]
MRMVRVPLLLVGMLMCAQGFAANTQQQKMATCNAEATTKELKGDERKAFMSTCLKAKKLTQQEKMTKCNAEATAQSLKGDERRTYMSECLKNK